MCIFCEILATRAEASFVYRDGQVAAFMDIHPVNPGHVLVVPIDHVADLAALDPDTGARVFTVAQRISTALYTSGLRCEGTNFFLADGAAAGQEVFHVHLHVFPRYGGDGFELRFSESYGTPIPRAVLEANAGQIRSALDSR